MTDAAEPRTPEPPNAEPLAGDRGISPIAGRFGAGHTGKALVVAALVAGCGAFALATGRASAPRKMEAPDLPAKQVVPYEPAPTLDHPGPNPPPLTGPAPPSQTTSYPAAAPTSAGPSPLQAMRAAPLIAYSAGGGEPAQVPSLPRLLAEEGGGAPSELDRLRRGSAVGQVRARRLGDRNFLILAGTSLPCILQTAMDSATPGYVSCVIPQDVYSDNGATVLLEKGTRVLGEYRAGLKAGQGRLFVLWTRAVTPEGVAIDLTSPASDALGRAGFDGDIDTHFWARFGGALLLSIVEGGAAALAPTTGDLATLRVPSDAAAVALQHSIDLPPTLKKPQGAEVAIFAAQDFDFSGVYGLKAR